MMATLFSPELAKLGLTPFFQNQVLARSAELGVDPATLLVGRIACERRGEYDVATAERTLRATMSGRLAHELGEDDRPAVGDWVIVEPAHPVGRLKALLERQTVLRRKLVGASSRAQTLAANVDLCCVVSALVAEDADGRAQRHALNARRIERYLRTAHDSRIEALVVINKADLVRKERATDLASALERELPGADIVLVSARDPEGLRPISERLSAGVTAVLLGSSGVQHRQWPARTRDRARGGHARAGRPWPPHHHRARALAIAHGRYTHRHPWDARARPLGGRGHRRVEHRVRGSGRALRGLSIQRLCTSR